jgi:tetratricopeptide (TPR) repeat protein
LLLKQGETAAKVPKDSAQSLFKKMCFKPRLLLALPLLFAGLVYGQTAATGTIHGNVVAPDGSALNGAVRVTLKVLRGDSMMAYTDQFGRFDLMNVAQGEYTIEADSDRERRYDVGSERVQVRRGVASLVTIYLKAKRSETRIGGDKSVSVAMFDQKVPSAAKREFESASRASAEGNRIESIAALRRAIAIYPNYLMAHNDLGAQLLEQGELDEAAAELRAAIKIDPKAPNPQVNLGIVLERQNNFAASLAELDKALSLDPASPVAHLYAGMDAVKLDDTARGEKELKAAHELGGTSYAIALLHLGKLYVKRGERELALESFQSYLRESPNAADAAQVEKLIGMLR